MNILNRIAKTSLILATFAVGGTAQAVNLGSFQFDASKFGNTLIESDGGAYSARNWLNVVNADPGNPAYLTGANFDTGIANIGLSGPISYTIGYTSGILNRAGNDLGIVVARYSTDPITVEFSSDGVTFTAPVVLSSALAVATGVNRTYYYGGAGPYPSSLYVTPVDLSTFGFAPGSSIVAARITGTTELDLIRVAGLGAVPEPVSWAMMVSGFGLVGAGMRRRSRAPLAV